MIDLQLLGIPSKFKVWRESQEQAVLTALTSPTRFTAQIQPTGSGKSLCYIVLSKMLDCRTLILTSTKGLQDQLTTEFPFVKGIKGKFNYPCLRQSVTGKDGHKCRNCNYKYKNCVHYQEIQKAKESQIVVTNYAFWLSNSADVLGDFDLLVCDEAHDVVTSLISSMTIVFTPFELESIGVTSYDALTRFLNRNINNENQLDVGLLEQSGIKISEEFCLKCRKLIMLTGIFTGKDLVIDTTNIAEDGIVIEPVWPTDFAEDFLWRDIKKVILTSATITKSIHELLGISDNDITYFEYPSYFPVASRPIIWIPTARYDYRISHIMQAIWLSRIDQIIASRLDCKGIIHSVSYQKATQIYYNSQYRDFMLLGERGGNTTALVAKFKKSSAPSILISPSVSTGFDFPYDMCSYQIICKVPFPDLRGEANQKRKLRVKKWGDYLTFQNLVQSIGRGMRAKDDFCENFIIDDHISWFIGKNKQDFPEWFLKAYMRSDVIPIKKHIIRNIS